MNTTSSFNGTPNYDVKVKRNNAHYEPKSLIYENNHKQVLNDLIKK